MVRWRGPGGEDTAAARLGVRKRSVLDKGLYFGGGIDVEVAGPALAYVQTRMGPSGHYTWQFIGGIRYVVR